MAPSVRRSSQKGDEATTGWKPSLVLGEAERRRPHHHKALSVGDMDIAQAALLSPSSPEPLLRLVLCSAHA